MCAAATSTLNQGEGRLIGHELRRGWKFATHPFIFVRVAYWPDIFDLPISRACVGKSRSAERNFAPSEIYPRVCGGIRR